MRIDKCEKQCQTLSTTAVNVSLYEKQSNVMQVLANPTADIQEGPKVGRAELKARGVRPYDEKVMKYNKLCLPNALVAYILDLSIAIDGSHNQRASYCIVLFSADCCAVYACVQPGLSHRMLS